MIFMMNVQKKMVITSNSLAGNTKLIPHNNAANKYAVNARGKDINMHFKMVNTGAPVNLTSLIQEIADRNSNSEHIERNTFNFKVFLNSISNSDGI